MSAVKTFLTVLSFLTIAFSFSTSFAGPKDEVAQAQKNSPEYREQQQNIWTTKALRKVAQKAGASLRSIQFEVWEACALNMEGVTAYVKLEDGRACEVSVHFWSSDELDGTFECYRDKKAVRGFAYTLKVGPAEAFTNIKLSQAAMPANTCF